jgi:tRNA threonylcarbamoyl adenosine modification protein YjeE
VTGIERLTSQSASATEDAGLRMAEHIGPGDVLLLEGDLAAGKTTFVRGLVHGLGGDPAAVSSPTFVLVQSYDCQKDEVDVLHHVDLYRLAENLADLREIGLEDIFSEDTAVVAVEWPKDTLATWIPATARVWRVAITTREDDSRLIEVTSPEL